MEWGWEGAAATNVYLEAADTGCRIILTRTLRIEKIFLLFTGS
jgi:hypothetical protein